MDGGRNGRERGDAPFSVVVADGQPAFARSLAHYFETTPGPAAAAGVATSAAAVVELVERTAPDLLLLDVWLPAHRDGIEAAATVRVRFPDVHIVFFTTSDEDADVYDALALGARGYLLKGTDVDALVDALAAVHAGGVTLSPRVVPALLDPGAPEVHSDLTHWEREVLEMVSQGLPTDALARTLAMSVSTVKRRLREIEHKMGVANRVQAVAKAARMGWI